MTKLRLSVDLKKLLKLQDDIVDPSKTKAVPTTFTEIAKDEAKNTTKGIKAINKKSDIKLLEKENVIKKEIEDLNKEIQKIKDTPGPITKSEQDKIDLLNKKIKNKQIGTEINADFKSIVKSELSQAEKEIIDKSKPKARLDKDIIGDLLKEKSNKATSLAKRNALDAMSSASGQSMATTGLNAIQQQLLDKLLLAEAGVTDFATSSTFADLQKNRPEQLEAPKSRVAQLLEEEQTAKKKAKQTIQEYERKRNKK
jgi:hypothetical protein